MITGSFTGGHRFYYGKPVTGTTSLGLFGAHRFYMEKWISAVVYLLTGGLLGLGILFDLWTLNDQIAQVNQR